MPKTYYDSELTGAQIESTLEAIHGVVTPSNNGKVLCIVNGAIAAKSASEWGHGAVLEPLSVTANGDYTPPSGTDGFDSVHVAVPSATLTTKSITQNGTYNASQDNADGYSSVTVDVQGGGSAVVQPLSVTQNGTYNPPSGVDGYAPVTVNVSGGGGRSNLVDLVTIESGALNSNGTGYYPDLAHPNNKRIRTQLIPAKPNTQYRVSINQDYSFWLLPFDGTGVYVKNVYTSGWQKEHIFTSVQYLFAVLVKKDDDSVLSPSAETELSFVEVTS